MSLPTKPNNDGDNIIEFLIQGDLEKLTPEQRAEYLVTLCKSLGLNHLTRPFEFIRLSGKLVAYAKRDAADQLRKIRGISIQLVSQDITDGMLSVHVKARDKEGREDEDVGVVNFPKDVKGELRANLIMKCVTKAKRRVTLSISGLGFLDETEVEDIRRVNPHVTTPSDITDVPPPDHPDRIPAGDPEIKQLPKKDAREIGNNLNLEMNAFESAKALQEWAKKNRNRVALLPSDWQDIFQGRYLEHLSALRTAESVPAEPDWLETLAAEYRACTSAADVFVVDQRFPRDTLSLEDQVRASTLREDNLKRIEAQEDRS